jgi:hypothetical protein
MRRRFNRGRYYERVLSGELQTRLKDTHPTRTKANEPYCTRTQEVFYIDPATRLEVARIHQYLRTDGTLGASGLPDPKAIFENGTMYRLRKPPKGLRQRIRYLLSDWRDRLYWKIGVEVD